MEKNDTFFSRLEKNYKLLTKKQMRLGDYLKLNYKSAVFLNCLPLGEKVGISAASVVRFANALGYSGFSEMIEHIQLYIQGEASPMDKFARFSVDGNVDLLHQMIESNLNLIRSLPNTITSEKIDLLIKDMISAKKVVLLGFDGLAGMVEYFGFFLIRAGCPVEIVTEKYGDFFKLINFADEDTLAITIDFAPYVQHQLQLGKQLKEKGVKICAITDEVDSPMCENADYELFIPFENKPKLNMEIFGAVLVLFQFIIFKYGLENYSEVRENLTRLNEFNKSFHILME